MHKFICFESISSPSQTTFIYEVNLFTHLPLTLAILIEKGKSFSKMLWDWYRIQSTTIPFFSTRTIFIFLAKPQKYKVLLTQMCSLHCCELCVEFKNDLFCVSFFDVKILNSFLFRKQELKQITSMGRNNSQLQC